MRIVAIIQARMGSTRLPGKVLADIAGRSMLAWVVARTERASLLDDVVVATTERPEDDCLSAACEQLGVKVFRGSEHDVLDRYFMAARATAAGGVVRVTADCPFVDPAVIDLVVRTFRASPADYASNTLGRSFPRGLDVEVFSNLALEKAWREASRPDQRAHVTPYFYQNPAMFSLCAVRCERDVSHLRWTVDTASDLEVVRAIVRALGGRNDFGWREALAAVERSPIQLTANRNVTQKALRDL